MIVSGDLNLTCYSSGFGDFARAGGLHDTMRGQGLQPTWPTQWPWFMRIPIDHCLVSPELGVRSRRLGGDIASDHMPVLVDLVVP